MSGDAGHRTNGSVPGIASAFSHKQGRTLPCIAEHFPPFRYEKETAGRAWHGVIPCRKSAMPPQRIGLVHRGFAFDLTDRERLAIGSAFDHRTRDAVQIAL